ncbi:hypothetical protein ACFL1G_03705 [Planctomycetota bacterium]
MRLFTADFDPDCDVDYNDLAILVEEWLQTSPEYTDIVPLPDGDEIVNMLDFALLADNWLEGVE